MTYKESQKRAAELGIKAVGLKKADLEAAIIQAEQSVSENNPTKQTQENNETEKKESMTEKVTPKQSADVNTAIVMNGNHEVRRYSSAIHGEKFADLATEFASDRKYTIKLVKSEPGHKCPNCGFEINIG